MNEPENWAVFGVNFNADPEIHATATWSFVKLFPSEQDGKQWIAEHENNPRYNHYMFGGPYPVQEIPS